MKVKEESEKVGLKLNIQKTNIMASGPNSSRQTDGETMETVTDFSFGGSKITADGDWSHEIKRPLLLGRKAMTNLDSILKSRDIMLPTNVCLVKVMVFPVVTYGCESWTIKKDEHQKSDAFELWCWRDSWKSLGLQGDPVHLKENQPWILSGKTDADAKSWLIWKDPDGGKEWEWEDKEMTEDEMVGWHHQLNGRECE